jgi:hypothetical protein
MGAAADREVDGIELARQEKAWRQIGSGAPPPDPPGAADGQADEAAERWQRTHRRESDV